MAIPSFGDTELVNLACVSLRTGNKFTLKVNSLLHLRKRPIGPPGTAGKCSVSGDDVPSGRWHHFNAEWSVRVTCKSHEASMFEKFFLGAVSTFAAVVVFLSLLEIAAALLS